jgi:heptosyltransferase-1
MRVLVVKLSSLGDVIHTLPALSDAAAALPGIRFDWVVEEAFAQIPQWHPAVEQVIPVAIRRWRKRPLRDFRGSEWRRARSALRGRQYDAVIDAQGLMKSAFIARLVKAPRYGMDRRSVRERLAAAVYHHGIPVPREMHAVQRIRLLFARALGYPVPQGQGDYGLRQEFAPQVQKQLPSLLFFHGTARAEKLWPQAYWVELAELAVAQGLTVYLPWGSDTERGRAEAIAGSVNCAPDRVQVLPPLDLSGLAGRLLEVRGAVAVDTGLGHLAAALDVPTVSLYGPTRPALVGAYGRNQVHLNAVDTIDAAGARGTMQSIRVSTVWQALQNLLSRNAVVGNKQATPLGEE